MTQNAIYLIFLLITLKDLKQAVEFVRVMLWNYQEFNYYSFGQFHVMLRLSPFYSLHRDEVSQKIIQLNLQIKDTKRRSYSLLIECIRWLSKTLFLVTSPPPAVSYIFKYGPSPTWKSILPFPNRAKDWMRLVDVWRDNNLLWTS
jgi:hypothetical protein